MTYIVEHESGLRVAVEARYAGRLGRTVNRKHASLLGMRFGRLVCAEWKRAASGYRHLWLCVCDCGNSAMVGTHDLQSGHSQSCGCLAKELSVARETKHGEAGSSLEHKTWSAMLTRCRNESLPTSKHYVGRGIAVCDRWCNSFENFLADMGRRPSPKHSIDRIDNDGNYEPGNCRWATQAQQSRNKSNSRMITANGETMALCDWSTRTGISVGAIWARMHRGWSAERALSEPVAVPK